MKYQLLLCCAISAMNFYKKMTPYLKRSFILYFSLFLSLMLPAQKVDSTFDLYLLIGQSNMAGRGEITDEYKNEGNPRILMLDKNNNWVQAKHPLHFDKPSVAGVGPGLSFAMEMAKKTSHKIGLIPCAVGGTSIDSWKPGGYDKATDTHPYDDAIKRLGIAMQWGTLKGVIWLQGESDSDTEKAKNYLAKLEELIARIRTTTNIATLPFVAGELGRYKKQYQNINKLLAQLPRKVLHTSMASSKGLKHKGDGTHFDSVSAGKMGKRFAKQMQRLQKRLRK